MYTDSKPHYRSKVDPATIRKPRSFSVTDQQYQRLYERAQAANSSVSAFLIKELGL